MSSDDEMRAIADGQKTIADKIRALAAANHTRADIARVLQRSYQQVRNVLEQDKVRAKASKPASGVAETPAVYETEVDEAFRAKYPPTIRLTLDKNGGLVLPAALLNTMRWRADGGVIIAEVREDGLFLMSTDTSVRRVQQKLRDILPPEAFEESWADALIAERRREAAAEENE
jgi:bifunctional DNA-binding transcriptional regulator/antitoxin component of YhaV-PrlF toxin-antitoxin module